MVGLLIALMLSQDAAAVIYAAAPPSTVPATQPVLPARVLTVDGLVQTRGTADEAWRAVQIDDVIQEGAEIRTGVRSRVVLQFANASEGTIDRLGVLKLSPECLRDGRFVTDLGIKYRRIISRLPTTAPATQPAMPATTTAVEGNAQFRARPHDEWAVLPVGVVLPAGAQVRVAARAVVRLRLVDGRQAVLSTAGTYTLDDLYLENGYFLNDDMIRPRTRGPLLVR